MKNIFSNLEVSCIKQQVLFVFASLLLAASLPFVSIAAEDKSVVMPYTGSLNPITIDKDSLGEMGQYAVAAYKDDNGDTLVKVVVPDLPSEQRISGPAIENLPLGSKVLTDVPAFKWKYGCSPTSAGMFCGYYDRNGFPNMYVGSGDCLADFMGTSQWYPANLNNPDGATAFTYYLNGSPYSASSFGDLAWGIKAYIAYRGYTVSSYYNQLIYSGSAPNGFTFQDFKDEIDAGNPVLIHVTGHTMLGVGYDDSSNTIYIHDTWNYNRHSMTWGGSYSGMSHQAVTVVKIQGTGTLTPPTNLNASDGTYNNRILITWSPVTGATHYRLARAASASGIGIIYGSWQGGTSYSDYGANPGVGYYYWVQAATSSSGANASAFSAYNTGYRGFPETLPAPAWISASDGTRSDGVALSWASVSGATHYKLARSTSSSGAGAVFSSWYAGTSLLDTSATQGVIYYYWVQAARSSSGADASSFSSYNSGYRASESVPAPAWISASDGTRSDGVALSWASVSGATHYKLARSTSSSGSGAVYSSWYGGTSLLDTSATAGVTYYYWVQAARSSSGSGASAFSNYNSGYRALPQADPYEPTDTTTQFDLTPYNGKWLSQILGRASIASASDDDYYKGYFQAGTYNFTLLLKFVHSLGDLDLYLYDYDGTLLAASISETDDESITGTFTLPTSRWIYVGVKLCCSAPSYPVMYDFGYIATLTSSSSSGEISEGSACTFVSDVAVEETSK